MKNKLIFLAGSAMLLWTGCAENSVTGNNVPNQKPPFEQAKSASVNRETGSVPSTHLETRSAGNNAFAIHLYKELVKTSNGNLFFSPYSISAALGMTTAGAKGETNTQIREVLQATLEGDDFHAALNGLDLSFHAHSSATKGVTLRVVNSTWAQTGWDFKLSYLDKLARYYGAGVNLLDFRNEPDPSRIIINDWVANQTNDKIRDLLPQGTITSLTRLVLTNAIYFLGTWQQRFLKEKTTDQEFTRLDNSKVTVPLMYLGKGDPGEEVRLLYYRQQNKVKAIDLPYKGNRLCMTVILPDAGTFSSYESGLTYGDIEQIVEGLDSTDLPPIRLPRFTYTSPSLSIKDALKNLGMTAAFDGSLADFSGIDGRRDLVVSDVIHKAFVAVDEQGTEAAAATAVVFRETSIITDPPQFVADRPFIFLIRDTQTKTVLFMGRILDPS